MRLAYFLLKNADHFMITNHFIKTIITRMIERIKRRGNDLGAVYGVLSNYLLLRLSPNEVKGFQNGLKWVAPSGYR